MLKSVLKDGFHRHYHLFTFGEPLPNVSIKPVSFFDPVLTETFVRNLRVPLGYWQTVILHHDSGYLRSADSPLQRITSMLIQGKLKLYPLWHLDQAAQANRTEIRYPAFRKDSDISYQLIPASMLLTDVAYSAMNVSDSKEIENIIASFKIDVDTLNSLLISCHLPVVNSVADSSKITGILIDAVQNGEMAVIELRKLAVPPQTTTDEDLPLDAKNKPPSLGPHEEADLAPPVAEKQPTTFKDQDSAAKAALDEANPASIKDNLEYGGVIYRDKLTGQYGYTGPVKGSDQGVDPFSEPIPDNAEMVGDYHTHGDYSVVDRKTGAAIRTSDPAKDDFNSDNFSGTDIRGITADGKGKPGYKGYLGTPSGTYKTYDPATGTTGVL